jgi:chromosome partitioning protein
VTHACSTEAQLDDHEKDRPPARLLAHTIIWVVASQKGGVGKSTVASNLAGAASRSGLKVLSVDGDSQATLSRDFVDTAPGEGVETALRRVLAGQDPRTGELIHREVFPRFDVLTAGLELDDLDQPLSELPGGVFALRNVLEGVVGDYDLVVIDTPPRLGFRMEMALMAAPQLGVIAVSDSAVASVRPLHQFHALVTALAAARPGIVWLGVVLNRFQSATKVAPLTSSLLDHPELRPFQSRIPQRQQIQNAQAELTPVVLWDRVADASTAFTLLMYEALERLADLLVAPSTTMEVG